MLRRCVFLAGRGGAIYTLVFIFLRTNFWDSFIFIIFQMVGGSMYSLYCLCFDNTKENKKSNHSRGDS